MSSQSFDERAFIMRVEMASANELASILARPTAQEERALRIYLGDDRYQRMHGMALRQASYRRGGGEKKGNVVVIHGVMGSELSLIDSNNNMDLLWINYWRMLGRGWLDRLLLADDGLGGKYNVRATGIMKTYYGELILTLNGEWNTQAFWFDWRKDLNIAADELNAQISSWFGESAPVHVVAHSMGGLVARTFIARHPKRWAAMQDRETNKKKGGRLIMLGTPNHGSFLIPQIITGLEPTVRKLALYDFRRNLRGVLDIVNSFAGSYQMLPSPLVAAKVEPLYKSETYDELNVPQRHLDNGKRHHEFLKDVVYEDRMIYIAGYNQSTYSDLLDMTQPNNIDSYDVTKKGDGWVTHELGILKTKEGKKITTYYIDEAHGELPRNQQIISVMGDLLEAGETARLPDSNPATRGDEMESAASKEQARKQLKQAQDEDVEQFNALVLRAGRRSVDPSFNSNVSIEERKAQVSILRGFLGSGEEELKARTSRQERKFDVPEITISVECTSIDDIDLLKSDKGNPVDAISVGHYLGVRPQAAEKVLDQAISLALLKDVKTKKDGRLHEGDLVLTQYTERGILRGELGQPFFMSDPRTTNGRATERVIAIAGLGMPGRLGAPELTVTVRELCWALGRMGKTHLATILIGSGNGNLSIDASVGAWIRGIRHAITGSPQDEGRQLTRITFLEIDEDKAEEIQEAIVKAINSEEKKADKNTQEVNFKYAELNKTKSKQSEKSAAKNKTKQRSGQPATRAKIDDEDPVPVRIIFEMEKNKFRFAAITGDAAVPEREIILDSALVDSVNDELAAQWIPNKQFERGRLMEKLLIPEDIRRHMSSTAPVVMMLNSTTARIHWEIIARSDPISASAHENVEYGEYFLGTSRGFTRQLRTTFAPPPEPPPPPRRVLRVLVVADPAADMPLPGAEEEGIEVADLFDSFNTVWSLPDNRIEVKRLFGPNEATRSNVLSELLLRSYDVLHFAGHCYFNPNDPPASGWIFGKSELLTANELNRIDRIPKFVFSNACESGVTPDRPEGRTAALAPSFAEAFFGRGVANFVCTAWPVDDIAARQFALTLYSRLLGLEEVEAGKNHYRHAMPQPMHEAMHEARLSIASAPYDARTWGAYQHYGSPYFRLFDRETMRQARNEREVGEEKNSASAAKKPNQGGAARKKSRAKR